MSKTIYIVAVSVANCADILGVFNTHKEAEKCLNKEIDSWLEENTETRDEATFDTYEKGSSDKNKEEGYYMSEGGDMYSWQIFTKEI